MEQVVSTDVKGKDIMLMPEAPNVRSFHYGRFSQVIGMKPSTKQLIINKFLEQKTLSFVLPNEWLNFISFISFGIVQSPFYFYINHKRVGKCSEENISNTFNITEFVMYDQENVLMIEPINEAHNEEFQNCFETICVYGEPPIHIKDYFVSGRLEDDYEDAYLKVDIEIVNFTANDEAMQAEAYLSEKIEDLEKGFMSDCRLVVNKGSSKKVSIEAKIINPHKWSSDMPYLYQGAIVLKNHSGQVISIKKFSFGFRCIEIHNAQLMLNGFPLIIKGVNGQSLGLSQSIYGNEQDEVIIKNLKRAYVNGIRIQVSRYPYLADLCDKYGIYLMDEIPLTSSKEIEHQGMNALKNMIHLNRNHPSVIIWSLSNHSENGNIFLQMKKLGLSMDITRPYHYEGDLELIISDFLSKPDGTMAYMDQIGADEERYKKPSLLSNYGIIAGGFHAIEAYMNRFQKYNNWCGGFLFEQFTTAILEHKGESELIKKAFQSLEIKEIALSENKIAIINKSAFKPLERYQIKWELLEDGEILKRGIVPGTDIEPKAMALIQLPIGTYQQLESAEYHLNIYICLDEENAYCEADEVLGWAQFQMPYEVLVKAKKMSQKSLTVYDRRIKVEIIGDGFSFRVSKLTGDITSLIFEDREYLLSPLRLNLDRPTHINGLIAKICGKKCISEYKVQEVYIENLKTEVMIKVLRKAKFVKNSIITEYTIDGNGNLFVEHQLTPKKNLCQFGSSLEISNEFRRISWFGKGLEENLVEKSLGEKVGVYSCDINEYSHNFEDPKESANRTEIRWFSATTEEGEGLIFEDIDKTLLNMSAWPYEYRMDEGKNRERMKDTITLSIDHQEKPFSGRPDSRSKNDQKLHKNVEYQCRYKICRAF